MSVKIEFLNLIMPRKIFNTIYNDPDDPNEIDDDPSQNQIDTMLKYVGRKHDFYDDDLIRFGAMNPQDIEHMIKIYTRAGLRGHEKINGIETWIDFCVVDMFGGLTLPCPWLKVENFKGYYIGNQEQ